MYSDAAWAHETYDDYDYDYEDDPHYRALYLQEPGDVTVLHDILDRIGTIGETYQCNLPTFYVPSTMVTWDTDDIPF